MLLFSFLLNCITTIILASSITLENKWFWNYPTATMPRMKRVSWKWPGDQKEWLVALAGLQGGTHRVMVRETIGSIDHDMFPIASQRQWIRWYQSLDRKLDWTCSSRTAILLIYSTRPRSDWMIISVIISVPNLSPLDYYTCGVIEKQTKRLAIEAMPFLAI